MYTCIVTAIHTSGQCCAKSFGHYGVPRRL